MEILLNLALNETVTGWDYVTFAIVSSPFLVLICVYLFCLYVATRVELRNERRYRRYLERFTAKDYK